MLQTKIRAFALIGAAVLLMGYDQQTVFTPPPSILYRATCVSHTSPTALETYTLTFSGLNDEDSVALFLGAVTEGSGTALNTASADSVEMLTVASAGSGNLRTHFARMRFVLTNNAASVDFGVDWSVSTPTSAVVCAWAIKNAESYAVSSSAATDDETAAASLTLTTPQAQIAYAKGLGICGSANPADTATWTALTEREDSNNGEIAFSNADTEYTAYEPAGASALAATCDYTGSSNTSGIVITNR
jgi:hypothetical protein